MSKLNKSHSDMLPLNSGSISLWDQKVNKYGGFLHFSWEIENLKKTGTAT